MIETTSTIAGVGNTFGRFTVLGIFKETATHHRYARVQCSCGSPPRYVRIDGLRNGKSQSCGCLHKERITKHGAWGTPLFKVWSGMMRRCYANNDTKYQRYGGRGITVCERWHNPNNFILDMSKSYEQGLQIDRKNNDGNYEPSNCKWSTTKQQTRNYSRNVILEHKGMRMCVIDWANELGLNPKVLYERKQRGWPDHKILTQKVTSVID